MKQIRLFQCALFVTASLLLIAPVLAQNQWQRPKRYLEPRIGNNHVTTNRLLVKIDVGTEIPARIAYWVLGKEPRHDSELNEAEINKLTWMPFQPEIMVDLGPGAGDRRIWFVTEFENPKGYMQTKRNVTVDDTMPTIVITYPTNRITSQPWLQLQGYASGMMLNLHYDISNSSGSKLNQNALPTDRQGWDQNTFDWTKFCFQCYDIALAPGTNSITFHCEVAGNQLSTNIEVVFTTAQDTNPPVITPRWPTNGMFVSGPNFTARGMLDDYTASLKGVISGGERTNEIRGLVERNGNFWLENIPLLAETNELALIATDAASNSSTTILTIYKSDVDLVIESTPTGQDLYKSFGFVTGRVKPGYDVYVNGVKAVVEPNGHWHADKTPIYGMGTATFDVTAIPTETSPTATHQPRGIKNLLSSTANLGQEPIVLNASHAACGNFSLHLTGTSGKSFILLNSTNLVNWTPILTNINSTASFDFTYTNAANYPCRFFRVVPVN